MAPRDYTGLLLIGDTEELAFLFSGGIQLEIDYTPPLLYQVGKMDGAIVLNTLYYDNLAVAAQLGLVPEGVPA